MSRMHPREKVVRQARIALMEALGAWQEAHEDLTDAELLSLLSGELHSQISGVVKYMIRFERHGDTDTPGGLE
jgi:hypothetical protein